MRCAKGQDGAAASAAASIQREEWMKDQRILWGVLLVAVALFMVWNLGLFA
jgi:hypothetical protein